MQQVAPIIEIVNAGVDWPAVAAGIATGVVGVAGIGGTLWQASRNWNRDDTRAKLAEKRRIYAHLLSVIPIALAEALERTQKDKPEDRTRNSQRLWTR